MDLDLRKLRHLFILSKKQECFSPDEIKTAPRQAIASVCITAPEYRKFALYLGHLRLPAVVTERLKVL